ncbi:MAG TPA: DNA starvation/stationary phase protection protein [Longimicrobiales bacterium]
MASVPFPRPHSPSGASQPHLHQHGHEVQRFDQLRDMPIGLSADVRGEVASELNVILSDTRILHDLYKKTHWLMRGATFYQLHLLMDKHAEEQEELVDLLAERVQTLGAVAVGDPRHVAELTRVERPPDGAEEVPAMLSRLLDAHELIIKETRDLARRAEELGDLASNDILVSNVLRTNELQAWFVSEHLVEGPLVVVREEGGRGGPAGETH